MDIMDRNLGQLLADFRQYHHLTQDGFAMRVGWSKSTVCRLETGKQPFGWIHLNDLANSKLLSKDSPWYKRFERALTGEKEVQMVRIENLRELAEAIAEILRAT